MHYYDNAIGDRCAVEITVGTLKRVKSQTGIDLINDPTSFPSDLDDLVTMLWVIEHGAKEHPMQPDAYCDTLNESALRDAAEATAKELALFFSALNPAAGTLIAMAWESSERLSDEQAKLVGNAIGQLCTGLLEPSESSQTDCNSGN